MRILINDHCGHPFQVQLSRSLAARGHEVLHTYTGNLETPRGALERKPTDPDTFKISPLLLEKPFSRYGLLQRFRQELELGRRLEEKVQDFKPDVVISSNTPIGSQAILLSACEKAGISMVFWLQDILGFGIKVNLEKKLPFIGSLIGEYYVRREKFLLHKSRSIVVITEDFVPVCRDAGVNDANIHVIHNWAPLNELPVVDKHNVWSVDMGLDKTFNFLYSGTLGMKHNPRVLVDLALSFQGRANVRVVVITEGLGAEYLARQKSKHGLDNLVLMPFQPFEFFPQVQASGDVLIAILEPDAGVFAVPSKVLTSLCARKPLLMAVPPQNLAASTVSANGAGIVVSPDDIDGFIQGAERLYESIVLRESMAVNGRSYAETHFDIAHITDEFERIISRYLQP